LHARPVGKGLQGSCVSMRSGAACARERKFEVRKSEYEFSAVITLVLVGALFIVRGSAASEAYAERSASSQIDVAPQAAAAKEVEAAREIPGRRLGVPPARVWPNKSDGACIPACL
jgi:hypothetical protein